VAPPADVTRAAGWVTLWHAAGRAAQDAKKRFLALQGVAWSGPVLGLGSWLVGLLTLPARETTLGQPLAYVLEPLRRAYEQDRDGAVLLYLVVQGLLLALVWGFFGGALARLAAVELTGRGRERGPTALAFARRRLGALWGAPLLFAAALLVPLALAWAAAWLAGLPGVFGGLLAPLAIVAIVALALLAVVGTSLVLACAFLARPAVAADDADVFDAVTRSVTYAWGGLPRLAAVRLWFLGGVLLGSGWRLVRTVLTVVLATWLIERALGAERLDRLLAVLSARGLPADAERLGLGAFDVAAAAALGLCAAALAALWLADLMSRVACARVASYLLLRRVVDRVELTHLATPPGEAAPQSAEEAGFEEVGRVGMP
jgi:hypothetical protein